MNKDDEGPEPTDYTPRERDMKNKAGYIEDKPDWITGFGMGEGPFFNKAWKRRQYEEAQKDKRRELSHLGPNFQPPVKAVSKPAYEPRKSPVNDYVAPLNYTKEELRERRAWLKEAKSSGARPEAYRRASLSNKH